MDDPLPATWQNFTFQDRNSAGEPNLLEEEDEVLLQAYVDVLLTLGRNLDRGVGKLFVTSRRVIWLSAEDAQQDVAVAFSSIAMHAQCSNDSTFPRPCIYAQLHGSSDGLDHEYGLEGEMNDSAADLSSGAGDGSADAGDEALEDESLELRFSPQDVGCLEDMFKVFCTAASMNPDEEVQEEGNASLFFNEEEVMANVDPALREEMLARFDAMLQDGEDEDGSDYDDDEVDASEAARYDEDEEDDAPGLSMAGIANGH